MLNISASKLELYACLPFIEIAQESTIQMGPVLFWPSSKFEEWIDKENQSSFQAYIDSITQVKAKVISPQEKLVNTVILAPQGITCISILKDIPLNQRSHVVIDALYSIYFACTFRNLYYGNEIISFEAFKKIIPASLNFIKDKQNWEGLHIEETRREDTLCIHVFDQEIYSGLGKALSAIYLPSNSTEQQTEPRILDGYRCLIRSIRYLVDRFFQRFVNLFGKGLNISDDLFEPEDILFLSSSFESLFNIDDKYPAADFKHKLRPLLHLKYSRPVEIFWKWVDDFYDLKRKIVHEGSSPDPLFVANPNFRISHVQLGIKLFIYAFYYKLFQYQLISPIHFDSYTPPDFRWVHPEEILLFFWTESSLIEKLSVFIKRAQANTEEQELFAEISLLSDLFLSIYERYYSHPQSTYVQFIPAPLSQIESNAKEIIKVLEYEEAHNPHGHLIYSIPNDLLVALKERITLKQ